MMAAQLRQVLAAPPPDALAKSNHRIANSLTELAAALMRQFRVIETGPDTIPRELVSDLMKDMAGRIAALGRLHRLLSAPPAPGEVELDKLLTEVIDAYNSTGVFSDRLQVCVNVAGCRVAGSQASILMMIFSEIATNAVKYAHPSGLPIELTIAAARTRPAVWSCTSRTMASACPKTSTKNATLAAVSGWRAGWSKAPAVASR